jgi:hypothetical protein
VRFPEFVVKRLAGHGGSREWKNAKNTSGQGGTAGQPGFDGSRQISRKQTFAPKENNLNRRNGIFDAVRADIAAGGNEDSISLSSPPACCFPN